MSHGVRIGLYRRKHGYKLSHIVTFALLLSMFTILAVSAVTGYYAIKNSLTAQILSSNRAQAGEMSRTVQSLLHSMQANMQAASDYFSRNRLPEDEMERQLDFYRSATYLFNSAAVVSGKGVVLSISPHNLGLKGKELDTSGIRQALELKKPLISEPYLSANNKYTVLVSHPLIDGDGNYGGFIAGTIFTKEANIFQKILGSQTKQNGDGSYFYVVDASGRILFHPDQTRVGHDVTGNPAVGELVKGDGGARQVANSLGKRYLAGYEPIPETGWGIVYQTPARQVAAATEMMIERMALYAAPFLLGLLCLTLWLSAKLSVALQRLSAAASSLNAGGGNLAPLPRHWSYEVNQLNRNLSDAMNDMIKKTEKLLHESRTDALTGLPNRRTMDAVIGSWVEQQIPFAMILLDIDHFKAINDTYGHETGDEVLKFLAWILENGKGEHAVACRYGGEEFTVLLPNASKEEAYFAAERLRTQVETAVSPIGISITLSLGVSAYRPEEGIQALLRSADEALYEAKQKGRNRTVLFRSGKSSM